MHDTQLKENQPKQGRKKKGPFQLQLMLSQKRKCCVMMAAVRETRERVKCSSNTNETQRLNYHTCAKKVK